MLPIFLRHERHGHETVRVILNEITRLFYPFNPKSADVTITERIYDSSVVLVRIGALPGEVFAYEIPLDLYNPRELAFEIGLNAGIYFRDLPAPPLTDNIVLSDN